MKNYIQITFLSIVIVSFFNKPFAQKKSSVIYGDNQTVGKYAKINGTRIYYEEYGKGEPLLIFHSCGADIKAMEYQIDFFKHKFRVIAVDSRGQGKSELNTKTISYDKMAKDMEKFVKYLKLPVINILGWSDGGIIALKMGINNKVNIKKIVTMGVNLRPDTTAINEWAYKQVRENRKETLKKIKEGDKSLDWKKELLFDNLLLSQPNISHKELKKIKSPVLVMIGDRDIIKNNHAVEIFKNIPKSQLCIMPGTNHGAPRNNSDIFNNIALRFLTKNFLYNSEEEYE